MAFVGFDPYNSPIANAVRRTTEQMRLYRTGRYFTPQEGTGAVQKSLEARRLGVRRFAEIQEILKSRKG